MMCSIESLPEYEKNSFLIWVANATKKYLEDPENMRRFKEWEKEKKLKEQSECQAN